MNALPPSQVVTSAPQARLHYRPADGYVGDVHPFFYDGVYYLFYLKAPLEPERNGIEGMVSALATSRDLVHWTERRVSHQVGADQNGPEAREATAAAWWLISVVRNRETGRFYNFFTRGSGFFLSVSDDLLHWTPYPQNPVLPPHWDRYREWRDAWVFWNEADRHYWMLITSSLRGEPEETGGAISYARARDLVTWDFEGTLFHPGNVGSPECPDMFCMNGRWYLLASFQSRRGVGKTSYRIGPTPTGPWTAAVPDSLDGDDLCAGNTADDGTRRLLFGWIPTYGGPQEARGQQWGGDLAFPREIVALPDGSLGTRLPADFSARIRGRLCFPLPGRETLRPDTGEWTLTAETAVCKTAEGVAFLPGIYTRFDIETQIAAYPECKRAGFVLRLPEGSSGLQITVDYAHHCLRVQREGGKKTVFNTLPISIEPSAPMRVRLVLEGDIAEIFLNDRYSLATRLPQKPDAARIGIFTEGPASFTHLRAYELR